MEKIITMYVTLLPPILAGMLNMLWCKLPILNALKKPIDGGKILKDGKRLFGNSKTWKGFLGYGLTNILTFVLWGLACGSSPYLGSHNYFYMENDNTLWFNISVGFLLGMAYALFELPNSFLKRRLGIGQSMDIKTAKKIFFIFLDQVDSVFGLALVVWIFHDIGIVTYIQFIILGAVTHILANFLLYGMRLRKTLF